MGRAQHVEHGLARQDHVVGVTAASRSRRKSSLRGSDCPMPCSRISRPFPFRVCRLGLTTRRRAGIDPRAREFTATLAPPCGARSTNRRRCWRCEVGRKSRSRRRSAGFCRVIPGCRAAQYPRGLGVCPAQLTAILFEKKRKSSSIMARAYTLEPSISAAARRRSPRLSRARSTSPGLPSLLRPLPIQNARMTDLRVIGDLYQDAIGDYYTSQYAVLVEIADPQDRGPQGQGPRLERHRPVRSTWRCARCCATMAGGEARLHDPRGAVPRHDRHARGAQGRSRGLVTPFSVEAQRRGITRTLFTIKGCDGRDPDDIDGGARAMMSTRLSSGSGIEVPSRRALEIPKKSTSAARFLSMKAARRHQCRLGLAHRASLIVKERARDAARCARPRRG